MKKLLGLIATLVLLVMPMAFAAGPNGATAAGTTVCSATVADAPGDECGGPTNPTIASTLELVVGTITVGAPVTITVTGTTVEGPGTDTFVVPATPTTGDVIQSANGYHFSAIASIDDIAVGYTAGQTYSVRTKTSTLAAVAGGSTTAAGGVVSQLDVSGTASTNNWQGYVGQVSGTIELADAAGNQMKTWALAPGSVSGNIFFANAASIAWGSVAGNIATTYPVAEDGGVLAMSGATDSVTNTFDDSGGAGLTIAGSTIDTRSFALGNWDEYIYTDGTNYMYGTDIKSASNQIYDGSTSITDGFQIIVPTGNGARSAYYVFVELV